jgi:U3 small nucleolar RNA-associated protein 22
MSASSSSKRRKLDHDGQLATSTGSSNPDVESDTSADDAAAPVPNAGQSRSRRPQEATDNAVFAGSLYKSNMFKLQVDEMLAEVQPDYEKQFRGVNDALRRLKIQIEGIEPRDPLSVSFHSY